MTPRMQNPLDRRRTDPDRRYSIHEALVITLCFILAGSCIPADRRAGTRERLADAAASGRGPVAAAGNAPHAAPAEPTRLSYSPVVPCVVPEREVVGRSVEGRAIECITFGDGPDCVLIMATIHGNEDAGTPLVEHMIDWLAERPDLVEGRRIVLLPDVNPDGRLSQTRGNSRGVDLNRNYPAENFQPSARHGHAPLSEPESQVIDLVLRRFEPKRIISIHQPLNSRQAMIDYDGPADALAAAMAAHTDIPVQRIGSRPGSLGSYAGLTLGIPIITLELPPEAKAWPGRQLWEKYGAMMTASITHGADTAEAAVARAASEE